MERSLHGHKGVVSSRASKRLFNDNNNHIDVADSHVLQRQECLHQYAHVCQISSTAFMLPLISSTQPLKQPPLSSEDLPLVYTADVRRTLLKVNAELVVC